jgi:pantoate--beta-alanine ligase
MQIIATFAELRRVLAGHQDVALVPIMGTLHAGHPSLVRLARAGGGLVLTSTFVNPLQFRPQEDITSYPRTLERDCELLFSAGCDLLFAPSVEEMYPGNQDLSCSHRPPCARS